MIVCMAMAVNRHLKQFCRFNTGKCGGGYHRMIQRRGEISNERNESYFQTSGRDP